MHSSIPDNIEFRKTSVLDRMITSLTDHEHLRTKLQRICDLLPAAFTCPEKVSVRLTLDNEIVLSPGFKESAKVEKYAFEAPGDVEGLLEIHFSGNYQKRPEGINEMKCTGFLSKVASILVWNISTGRLSRLLYDNTERLKELKGIRRTTEILNKGNSIEESLKEICSFLPEAWQYPGDCVARITYGNKVFLSKPFTETPWVQKTVFETPDNQHGSIEIFYLREFPEASEGPFLKEERDLIDNLAALISGTVSQQSLRELLAQNTERLKELRGINQTSIILKESKSIDESLKYICSILPDAYQYPEFTRVRIKYGDKIYTSRNFTETPIVQMQEFDTPNGINGEIEVFYIQEFPAADEGPFLKEERNLLMNLANLISGSATKDILNNLLYENKERLKELHVINHTSYIISQGKPIDETLQKICYIMPKSWQYSRYTAVRINYEGRIYTSRDFKDTPWVMHETFVTFDNKQGSIEVFYLKEFPVSFEGPFLKEERQLIINLGKLISGYIDSYKGKEIYSKTSQETTADAQPRGLQAITC